MKALVPLTDAPLTEFLRGITEYGNQDEQVSLAQQVLYGLGIATAENVPPIKDGESLPEYIDRLEPSDLAAIEGLGIGQGQQLQECFTAATRLILYQQYVTNRWTLYAEKLGVDRWSPYVSHLLDDCLRISSPSEGRRWAVAIEVIAALYRQESQDRFGLVYRGDMVVDHETGEATEILEGLPSTAEDALKEHFNRYSRQMGVMLRDLFKEVNDYPYVPWDEMQGDHPAYKAMSEIRRLCGLAANPTLDDSQVNRQATQGKSLMPSWVLGEPPPPAWEAFLTQQFPDAVSATGSLGMGKRYVQVRQVQWPTCKICDGEMVIESAGPFCPKCRHAEVDGRLHFSIWSTRVADEYGRYPKEWTGGDRPSEWIKTAPEVMDIHGLKVSVWETTVDLEELDEG